MTYWRHFHHRLLAPIALLAVVIGLGVVEPCDTSDFVVGLDVYCRRPKISNVKLCCEEVENIFNVSMPTDDLRCLCNLDYMKFGRASGRLGGGLAALVDFYTMCGGSSPRAAQLLVQVCKLRGKEPAASSERLHTTRLHVVILSRSTSTAVSKTRRTLFGTPSVA
uniref:Bifunctional inhibitor/plant lipid transfer protein/seed storage helical domain-containing protein n=1 Tax=Leersia perrieri TaxID=77586 RepID=A0A0D9VX53_9ORYZ